MRNALQRGRRFGDRRGSGGAGGEMGAGEDCAGKGEVKERDHAYLAILVFCARDQSEPLIVEQWNSGNKRRPLCCCHWWGIVVWESLSPVPIHREGTLDAGAPQEFALPTQGRNWTLLYQSGHFTAQASQPWEMWGSVFTAAYCPRSKANTLWFGRHTSHPLDGDSMPQPNEQNNFQLNEMRIALQCNNSILLQSEFISQPLYLAQKNRLIVY